ncbi:MAG: alpha/beta hydrolase [Cytophagales bacterium]|nr:alpha/beta hydrolase [Cytophagales bacterium]
MTTLKVTLLILLGLYLLVGIGLYVFQERIVFRSKPLPEDYEYSFGQPFKELNLTMEDGAVLNALHFKSNEAKGIILYFHGNAGNLERWGEVVSPLTKYGYDVLVMDFRGYGKSTGVRTKQKMLSDSEEFYDHVLKEWPDEKISLYGRSMGSSFASYLVGIKNPAQLILESPFYSVADIGRRAGWIYPMNGILKFNFNNYESLKTATCPITIIHGIEDEIVPHDSGFRLYQSLDTVIAKFVAVENGRHNDLSDFDEYWDVVEELLR